MLEEIQALKRALDRERASRKIAEKILEEKSTELYELNSKLKLSNLNLESEVRKRTKEIELIARFPDENPSPVIRVNINCEIEYQNKASEDIFGENLASVVSSFKKMCNDVMHSESPLEYKLEFEKSYYSVSVVPIVEESYVNFYFSDITQEINSSKRLEISEERYREIVEESNDIIVKSDLDGDIIFSNGAALDFFDKEYGQLVGMNYSELLADESKEDFLQCIREKKSSNRLGSNFLITKVKSQTKSVRWLSMNFQFGKENQSTSVTITSRDITAQKTAEEKLKRSEQKYRSIIDNMRLGLLEVDNDNYITKAYNPFCELTGYTEEELLGKKAIEILIPNNKISDKIEVEAQRSKRKLGEESVYELPITKKDGSTAFVMISGAPLYDDYGTIIGSIGIHLDITDRKKIETELIKARLKAEESNRTKELFLANMSHEIRTPMNAIVGMTDLLLKTELCDHQRKMMQAVDISSKNLLVIINDILDLSKVDAGKMTFENIGFDLRKLISHIIETNKIKADSKDITLDFLIDNMLPEVLLGDPFRLNQVILNLVGNAIKFTDSGGVILNISVDAIRENVVNLTFSIKDTGKGIDSSKINKIFDSFDQEDNSISRTYGGTGLGLSITKKLVELQGGQIKVQSKLHEGSQFEVLLSYQIGSQDDLPITNTIDIDYNLLKGIRVLLAEDNIFNQTLIENLFLEHDINLTIANNGREVLGYLNKSSYDIVLMDIQMPEMDGVQAVKKIRANERWNNLPIIALTANAFKEEQLKYLDTGMNDCLSKPFNADDLYYKILKCTHKFENHQVVVNVLSEETNNDEIVDVEVDNLYSLSKLESMANGNEIFVNKMVNSFVEHTPEVLKHLEEAVEALNWPKVSSIAHRLKASLNTMDVKIIEGDVFDLEKKQNDFTESELIQKVNKVITVTNNVLTLLK